jgi:serine-type D-Ala-D-Ala carboxypeptidase (penicillin-binding protein 5/6)
MTKIRFSSRLTPVVALGAVAAVVAAACSASAVRHALDDRNRDYLGGHTWPTHGQAAFRIGTAPAQASPAQRPAPIASLAKVMTAYVVLGRRPLPAGAAGPTIVVTPHDERDYRMRRAQGQSVVAVRAGERLSERDALLALLLPSANNVAALLARFAAGTSETFVRAMNAQARALGMRHTVYTDPSGYNERTVSTAADQLLLAGIVARHDVLATMVARSSARLPVAGTVRNTDVLLGQDGFVGMKTGSDDAAGGCFMFESWRVVQRQLVPVVGVVLGQPGRHLMLTGQYAARQLVRKVAPVAAGG